MAACLFSRKRRSRGHEQELRLRRAVTVTTNRNRENYPSRNAFATHLSDSHSSIFSDLTNGFSIKYATLSHASFKEKGREQRNKKAAFTVARMKFLLIFQTQKTTQERIIVESFLLSARFQVRQLSLLDDTVHAVISVIHEKVYDKVQREVLKALRTVLPVKPNERDFRSPFCYNFASETPTEFIFSQLVNFANVTLSNA